MVEHAPKVSWWLTDDFATAARTYNEAARLMGDRGLPPAVRDLLLENEECQHRESSGIPPRRRPPTAGGTR